MDALSPFEIGLFQKLNTPAKIQDYLNSLPANFETRQETCYSPRLVIIKQTAHCLEGAIFAAAILRFHKQKPLLLDLRTTANDEDHVVALFRQNSRWGALSKTNHGVLRYREPIYRNLRELALSYFHEYFLDDGQKTLRFYSRPLNLSRFDRVHWITSEQPLFYIDAALDATPHFSLLTREAEKKLRKADPVEIAYGKIIEWQRNGKPNFTDTKK